MTDKTILDLESMLEENLDSIPDAPDFVIPPPGEYSLLVKDAAIEKYKTKKDPNNEKQRLKITYSILETISTATKEQPVPDGSIFTEQYQPTPESLAYFKKRIRDIMNASDVQGISLSEMMNSVKGCEFKARLTVKKTKGEDGTEYENINLRVIPS